MAVIGWRVSPSHHLIISTNEVEVTYEVRENDEGKMVDTSLHGIGLARSCNHVPVYSAYYAGQTAKLVAAQDRP